MATLATPANMAEAKARGKRCFAYSPATFEQYSADEGDYWDRPTGEPLRDTEGEPMLLAIKVTRYLDALEGTDLLEGG